MRSQIVSVTFQTNAHGMPGTILYTEVCADRFEREGRRQAEVWGPHGHLVVSRSVRSGAEIYGGLTKKIHPGDPIVVTASRASELITTEEVRRPRKGR